MKDILDADDSDSNHDPEHEDDGESDRDSFINKETPTISSRDYISDANIMGGNGEITKNILYPIAASSGNVLSVTSRELVSDTADTSKKVSALDSTKSSTRKVPKVLLDDNLMKLTGGRPFPLKYKAKVRYSLLLLCNLIYSYYFLFQLFFNKAVQNDTLFLSIVNVVDYSILVGFDEDAQEIVVGIIDYMRQVFIISFLVDVFMA